MLSQRYEKWSASRTILCAAMNYQHNSTVCACLCLFRSHADPRVHDRLRVALPQLLWAGCNEEGGLRADV